MAREYVKKKSQSTEREKGFLIVWTLVPASVLLLLVSGFFAYWHFHFPTNTTTQASVPVSRGHPVYVQNKEMVRVNAADKKEIPPVEFEFYSMLKESAVEKPLQTDKTPVKNEKKTLVKIEKKAKEIKSVKKKKEKASTPSLVAHRSRVAHHKPAGGQGYGLQVGIFTSRSAARQLLDRMHSFGVYGYISRYHAGQKTRYRAIAGRYLTRDRAVAVQRVLSHHHLKAWLKRV
jgi:cell division septation protein DedD